MPPLARRVPSIRRAAPPGTRDRTAGSRSASPPLLLILVLLIVILCCILLYLDLDLDLAAPADAEEVRLPPPPPPLRSYSEVRAAPAPPIERVHLVLATDEAEPIGLLAVINSSLTHAADADSLRFHLIVPADLRPRLRHAMGTAFPTAHIRMYSLDLGGVRAKIVRHLRRHEREPVFVSAYRFAVVYLPTLLPTLKRVVWLHTDVVVRGDLSELYNMPLDGLPAAAVEDCAHPLRSLVNTSHAAAADFRSTECIFNPGVLLIDLMQWSLLGIPARVEFWMEINSRTSNLYKHDSPLAPLLLAILPIYKKLPHEWNAAGLGRRKLSQDEVTAWKGYWAQRGVHYDANPLAPALIVTGGGAGVPAAKVLHFSGRFKPWLRQPPTAARLESRAVESRCRERLSQPSASASASASASTPGSASASASASASSHSQPADITCAKLWGPHAEAAMRQLGWEQREAATASTAALLTAVTVAGGEASDAPPLAPLEPEAPTELASAGPVHIAIVCWEAAPYGLVGAINSTLSHCPPADVHRLHFHVLVPSSLQVSISRKLGRLFPPELLVSVVAVPAGRLDRLQPRLRAVGVASPPVELPLLWLQHVLPSDVHRVLLMPSDALVLTPVAELHDVALGGRLGAVFEDCSMLFEAYFNHKHKLFNGHGRATCAFDTELLVLDLRAWKREDLAQKFLELIGLQRRNDGLYLQQAFALDSVAPLLLLLDKRVLRLPQRWLARGLARDGWTHSEAAYWHRYFGQQGLHFTFNTRPVRAYHATPTPRREVGDALIVRYSGGVYKPWVPRCTDKGTPSTAAITLCGRGSSDCAGIWRRFVAEAHEPVIEARESDASGALLTTKSALRPCIADPFPSKEERAAAGRVYDADEAIGASALVSAGGRGIGSSRNGLPGGVPLRTLIPNSSIARLQAKVKRKKTSTSTGRTASAAAR